MNKLQQVQQELKAPKGQRHNSGYNYRSCEDIMEAVKPILSKYELALILSDEVILVGTRVYVKATAQLVSEDSVIAEATAYAREQEDKLTRDGRPMMDHAQLTGCASSYARKYACNGLFAIDDTKDADTTHYTQQTTDQQPAQRPQSPPKPQGPTVEYLAGVRAWMKEQGIIEADACNAIGKPLEEATNQDFAMIKAMV